MDWGRGWRGQVVAVKFTSTWSTMKIVSSDCWVGTCMYDTLLQL